MLVGKFRNHPAELNSHDQEVTPAGATTHTLLTVTASVCLLTFTKCCPDSEYRRCSMSSDRDAMELGRNGASKHQSAGENKQGATVSFHNIHYKVKQGGGCFCLKKASTKDILIDLNGLMKPGLNAIMGATGSGKSSFLDVLAARKDPAGLSGEVLINGAPQPPNFKCLSGYVVQDDVVMGTLTVRQNFAFSAALRLPSSISQKEKEQKVEKLIQELGLGRVANSKVGTQLIRGISGGERKRTNIGMELIIDPPVLFLDEPTTGLDASTANSVLLLLKRMANHGRTIILSIHQPRYSIYRLFDSLTLLVNGKQVYHGPAQKALEYFSEIGYHCEAHNNPADFFLDVINGDSTAVTLSNLEGDDSQQDAESMSNANTTNRQKTSWVGSREIRFTSKPFGETKTLQRQIIDEHRTGALFFIVVNQCFSSLSAAELFIAERKLFIHEYISGYYRLSVYFLSKILSDIITLRTIPAIVFTCVAYYMIGLKPTAGAFFTFMFSVALVSYTATSMAMAISADQTVVAIANIFMTITCVFMMIFAGLLVNVTSIVNWLAWLKYLSIPRYGLSALQANEFPGLEFTWKGNISMSGEDYLTEQGVEHSTWGLWQNHLALSIMTICFLIIAYLKLRFIKKFT
ncbi:broad substrate specificity ATP-binding cassette transporter ABCG2-like [Gambusia affinis]|uniref:broad substrate specificity ATP-binding cassette transporter ABCG2-like n=1 Tax=Gambusia affinis TaxID=33528 RepID=UPI001CDD6786|nr:broad substrate specificity ATP-binding cassette transporter ABCG2-like [Gambusia affinis]